jgi:CheY-like chemotaxis protein
MTKILYVEDNDDNVYMLKSRLERRGYTVCVATDGEQGMEMARSEAPALIIMDLSLPTVDGWEATRRLKSDEETRGIPIVALSAHAMVGDRESALEAGCDDYDTKPVEFQRLLEKIEALLPEGSAP